MLLSQTFPKSNEAKRPNNVSLETIICQTSEEVSTVCEISSKNLENNSVYNGCNQNCEITQKGQIPFFRSRQGPLHYLISKEQDWNIHDKA